MNNLLRQLYLRERAKGWDARQAMRYARDRIKWNAIDGRFVRLRFEPDDCPDLSFLDQECFNSDRQGRAVTRWTRELAERDGVWGLIGEYRLSESDPWQTGDSVWGLIGEDTDHVEGDIIGETLDALRADAKDRCPACHGTGHKRQPERSRP